jgi:hypothetical protein
MTNCDTTFGGTQQLGYRCNATAGFFRGVALSNRSAAWGSNSLASDFSTAVNPITGHTLMGSENDINLGPSSAPNKVFGMQVTLGTGASATMPGNSYGYALQADNGVGAQKWGIGLVISQGATSEGIQLAAGCFSGNCASQSIVFGRGVGGVNTVDANITEDQNGNIFLNPTAGSVKLPSLVTSSICSSSASPAVCGSAMSGQVAVTNPAKTIQVNDTAVTANSQIFVFEDSSKAPGSATCNTTIGRTYMVTARSAGASFTITASAAPSTNSACLDYLIVN